jgi:O-acetyl-ADP-ribose deacetylase (regulator of RNase III)
VTGTPSFTNRYGNREFRVAVRDLLGAPVNAIVNAANAGLSHGGGVAEQIAHYAGEAFLADSRRVIAIVGRVPLTQCVVTTAGKLPYCGIIHAVSPRMTENNVGAKLETTIINALATADAHGWKSIAFPGLSTGIYGVPKEICARAFANAVPDYWRKNPGSQVTEVWLCLFLRDFETFHRVLQPAK